MGNNGQNCVPDKILNNMHSNARELENLAMQMSVANILFTEEQPSLTHIR